jgi:hypothetical protein
MLDVTMYGLLAAVQVVSTGILPPTGVSANTGVEATTMMITENSKIANLVLIIMASPSYIMQLRDRRFRIMKQKVNCCITEAVREASKNADTNGVFLGYSRKLQKDGLYLLYYASQTFKAIIFLLINKKAFCVTRSR